VVDDTGCIYFGSLYEEVAEADGVGDDGFLGRFTHGATVAPVFLEEDGEAEAMVAVDDVTVVVDEFGVSMEVDGERGRVAGGCAVQGEVPAFNLSSGAKRDVKHFAVAYIGVWVGRRDEAGGEDYPVLVK